MPTPNGALCKMIKRIIILSMSVLLLFGCKPKEVAEERSTCNPTDIKVDVNHEMMDVSWINPCKELISGYNIYISETPLNNSYPGTELPSSVKPFNDSSFVGDTNPDDGIEIFEAKNLKNNKKYYITVRMINPNMTLSKPSQEVIAVCGAREEIELSIRYKSNQDGYSFKDNQYVRADNLQNDLYFFSKDGTDYLNSPHKLDGFLNINKLAKLSYKGNFENLRSKIQSLRFKTDQDKVKIAKNDWLIMKTASGNYCLINVIGFSDSGVNRKVKLFIAYSSVPNELIF
jgi:hypothetical protein